MRLVFLHPVMFRVGNSKTPPHIDRKFSSSRKLQSSETKNGTDGKGRPQLILIEYETVKTTKATNCS